MTGNGKRLLLSRLVIDHRMTPTDPMSHADDGFNKLAGELLLTRDEVSLDEAKAAIAGA